METINNIAGGVSKAIWGEPNTTQGNETQGQEPISGTQGKGTVNEPFDQGNSENPTTTTDKPTTSEPTTTSANTEPTSNLTSSEPKLSHNPVNAAAGGPPEPLKDTDKTGVISGNVGESAKATDINPSDSSPNPGAAPASGALPTHKQQGADKPSDAPTGPQEGAVKESKDDAEDILKKRDPNDHSGEPMKVHGGNENPRTQEERRESKVGNPGGQKHGEDESSKGTGEEWVKTTGMASDGGDFDATKPGAGREADRLMEEKGIHKSEPGKPPAPAPEASGEKEKVPLGEKIKAKLHIGHKDK